MREFAVEQFRQRASDAQLLSYLLPLVQAIRYECELPMQVQKEIDDLQKFMKDLKEHDENFPPAGDAPEQQTYQNASAIAPRGDHSAGPVVAHVCMYACMYVRLYVCLDMPTPGCQKPRGCPKQPPVKSGPSPDSMYVGIYAFMCA